MEQDQDFHKIPDYSKRNGNRHPDPDVDNDAIIGPRLGRRESEPHSQEIMYLYDVLQANFSNSRTLWDLHHYFNVDGEKLDIQFDISFFEDFQIPQLLSSYHSAEYKNRIPNLAINILSKATYKSDVGENVDICKIIHIPVYIIFCSHPIGSGIYRPPFLRVYILNEQNEYVIYESRSHVVSEEDNEQKWNLDEIIDTSKYLPFRVGLMKMKRKLKPEQPTYRMIVIDREKNAFFKSSVEQEKVRADQEKVRADQEKVRADQEKVRADQEKVRADQEKSRAEEYKNLISHYEKKFGTI
jgi:Uma2 family endonuclease